MLHVIGGSVRTRLVAGVLAVAALGGALSASGASGRSKPRPKPLWATINICDAHGARLGIRGQMPGDGTHNLMYMRFIAQYSSHGGWRPVRGDGRSPWVYAGSAYFRSEQAGWTFSLSRPAAGTFYKLRGRVDYAWRARHGSRLITARRAHSVTEAGHPHTIGAQPATLSEAVCTITGPTKKH